MDMGSFQRMSTNGGNIMMDLDTSQGKEEKEETIEDLIRKLNQKGTKVKVLKDGEENITTPATGKSKSSKVNQANKENLPKGGETANEKDHEKEIDQIQRQNQEIIAEKEALAENLQSELQNKEQALENERKQKENLDKLIKEMEKKLVMGGHGIDDNDVARKEEIRKERMLQKELDKQKKKE